MNESTPQLKESIMNTRELASLFQRYGVDMSAYGVGKAKTLDQLLQEINAGESSLVVENGELIRIVNIISVDVYFERVPGERLRLRMEYQQFSDGRTRVRENDFGAVSGKMKPNESVEDAIARELGEEIKACEYQLEGIQTPIVNTRTSPSYPGISSRYTENYATAIIPPSMYRVSYEETQDGVTSHFSWVEA